MQPRNVLLVSIIRHPRLVVRLLPPDITSPVKITVKRTTFVRLAHIQRQVLLRAHYVRLVWLRSMVHRCVCPPLGSPPPSHRPGLVDCQLRSHREDPVLVLLGNPAVSRRDNRPRNPLGVLLAIRALIQALIPQGSRLDVPLLNQ
jgi:hypothetical protein